MHSSNPPKMASWAWTAYMVGRSIPPDIAMTGVGLKNLRKLQLFRINDIGSACKLRHSAALCPGAMHHAVTMTYTRATQQSDTTYTDARLCHVCSIGQDAMIEYYDSTPEN